MHDKFLELGGHSLNVTQIANRIQTEFNISIPISQIFEVSTMSELAALII